MYSGFSTMTAQQWEEAVTNAGRYVKTKCVFNGVTTLYGDGSDGSVVSIKFDEQMESSNGLSMGGTCSSQCKVEIRQPSTPINLANCTFVPYVGLTYNGDTEYVPLGEFFAVSADSNSNGGTVSVVGYDRFSKLTETYEPTIAFPASTTDIMNDLKANRFTFSGTVTSRTLDTYFVGTVKDWIGWLAGLEGCNARFDRDGNLEFVYYDKGNIAYSIGDDQQYMGGLGTSTVGAITINALVSGTDESPIVSGTGRSVTFNNPYMTQTVLDGILSSKFGLSFRPIELQWRGNPAIQCGDRVTVTNGSSSDIVLVMAHSLSVEGGMQDVLHCYGQTDAQLALDKTPTEIKIANAYNALQTAIQTATELIAGTQGGVFEITESNGINTGWLIKESSAPNYNGNVIVANYNGIGFSTDGGATYGTAITTDGHINGQYITAHSIDVEALSVGNSSDPFSNYVYIGRRRPNDNSTDMVVRIGVASQATVQEMRGNRTSIFKTSDINDYINGSLTDAQLDAKALMYYSDTDYVLLNLGSFRIGDMLMQAQANGGVKFIRAE